MITIEDLPAPGTGIEVVKLNETLIMGTFINSVSEGDPPVLKTIAVQDITGGMYMIWAVDIAEIRPHKQGLLM